MANEFKHASVGTELTQAEYEGTSAHVLDSQAAGDIIYASSTTQLSRLGIGTAGKILQVNSGASAPEWTAALTGVTSVLNTSLVVGRDSDNDIDFATDNTILFRAAGADQIKLIDGALAPVTDNDVDLGTSSLEFKDAFFDGTVTADAFAGPLTGDVTGTADVATVATTVTITDNESTNEDNAIIFTAGGDVDGGNIGLESDGTLTYNPSTGKITATGFIGALTGNADTATTLATARAINGVNFDGSAAITITAAGSTLSDTVPVSKGGTNATSLADKAVLITQDSGTDTVSAAAMSSNGQLLIGGTSGPAVGTLTAGSNVTITNADGEITIAALAGDITGVAAGVGLSGGGTSGDVTLTLDLSELSGVTPANGDSLATLDSDGSTEQLTTIANLATLFAGTGLTASSSVLSVDQGTASAKGAVIVAGGTGLSVSYSSGTATVSGDDASTSAKGIAQFSSDNFAASSGTITIKDGGIVTAELAADAVTSAKIADDAVTSDHIATNAVVTDSITDANVTLAKIANAAANTVIVRDANSSGVLSAKAVADTQLLIGDGTGFTAASLSGDVTMANDGAVTIANNAVETAMISDNNVTAAKIFDLARGSILYGNSSAATAELTAGSANTVLTSNGTDISWAAASGGGGIDLVKMFRLTSAFTGNAAPIASNLAVVNSDGYGGIGNDVDGTTADVTVSGGIFSFTVPGVYQISFDVFFQSAAVDHTMVGIIKTNTDYDNDATDFNAASNAYAELGSASTAQQHSHTSFIFDVPNATALNTHKVRFDVAGMDSSNTIQGDANQNYTYMTFIRLGDT